MSGRGGRRATANAGSSLCRTVRAAAALFSFAAATVAAEDIRVLAANFSRLPMPGADGELTVTLAGDPPVSLEGGLPAAGLAVRGAQGCAWAVAEQAVPQGGAVTFKVQAPEKLAIVRDRFDPSLDVEFTVERDGRREAAGRFRIEPAAEFLRDLAEVPPAAEIPRGPPELTVDGDLADWAGIGFVDLPYWRRKSETARFCWRDDGLYGAFDVVDANVELPASVAETWRADGVELWIETDGARALDVTRTAFAHKFCVGPDPANEGGAARAAATAGPLKGRPGAIEAAWRRTARGYTLEFRIPAETLAPARMGPGTRMGFHYVLFDDAGHAEDTREFIRGFFRKPYLWAALRFVAPERDTGGRGAEE